MADQVLAYALTGDASGAKAAFADVGASIATTAKRVDDMAKSVQSMAGKLDKAASSAGSMPAPLQAMAAEAEKATKFGEGLQAAAMKIPGVSSNLAGLTAVATTLMNPLIALPALFISGAVAALHMAGAQAETVTQLKHMSDMTGISVNALAALKKVGDPVGVGLDTIIAAASRLNTNMGKNAKAFKQLKIDATDPIEAMAQVADRFKNASTAAERARIGNEAFGKGWRDMAPMLIEGGKAIRDTAASNIISQGMIDRYEDIHKKNLEIEKSWGKIKTAIADLASGPMQDLLSIMVQIAKYETSWINDWRTAHGEQANVQDAESFLGKYMVKTGVLDDPKNPNGTKHQITSVAPNVDKLISALESMNLEERTKLIDGIMHMSKENVDPIYRSLLDKNGYINGLPAADLGGLQRDVNKDNFAKSHAALIKSQEEIDAEENAALKEKEFRFKIQSEISDMTAVGDQKEIISLQNKYALMIEEHKKYSESVKLIKEAESIALQNLQMKRNFAELGIERDQDAKQYDLEQAEGKRRFQSSWGSNDRAKLVHQMQNAGLVGDNGVGVYDANQMSIKEIQEALKNYDLAVDESTNKTIRDAAEMQNAWDGVSETIAGNFSNKFSSAFISIQNGSTSLASGMKNALISSLEDIEQKLLETTLKYAALTALEAFLPGSGMLTGGAGFLDFLVKGIGGHADGTLSSPGGLRFLGENGPEPYQTPSGARGIASYGLYHVPSGTRVQPAQKSPSNSLTIPISISGGDPLQNAEAIRRIVRDEFIKMNNDDYRTRFIS